MPGRATLLLACTNVSTFAEHKYVLSALLHLARVSDVMIVLVLVHVISANSCLITGPE